MMLPPEEGLMIANHHQADGMKAVKERELQYIATHDVNPTPKRWFSDFFERTRKRLSQPSELKAHIEHDPVATIPRNYFL